MSGSARKFMVIVFSSTYCLVIFGLTIALLKELVKVDTYIACLATFALIVREITNAYFTREDRKPKEDVK